MYSPPHGVLGNSEHSELRPPKGFQGVSETEVYVDTNDITGAVNVLPLSRPYRERLWRPIRKS
jgi:hypothetical protein